MNPEIEKLIDLAIADGQITDKERRVILRKSADLGADPDEVEMVLEGRLHQLEASKPKQSENAGNVKKCPACGASVKAMELVCSACGHEYTKLKGNSTVLELVGRIDQIELEKIEATRFLDSVRKFEKEQEFGARKKQVIMNYPVPNSKEDIIEFLTYSISKVTSLSELDNPWAAKADEILMKARLLFKNDIEMLSVLEKYETDLKKRKNGSIIFLIIIFVLIISIVALVLIFGDNLLKK